MSLVAIIQNSKFFPLFFPKQGSYQNSGTATAKSSLAALFFPRNFTRLLRLLSSDAIPTFNQFQNIILIHVSLVWNPPTFKNNHSNQQKMLNHCSLAGWTRSTSVLQSARLSGYTCADLPYRKCLSTTINCAGFWAHQVHFKK